MRFERPSGGQGSARAGIRKRLGLPDSFCAAGRDHALGACCGSKFLTMVTWLPLWLYQNLSTRPRASMMPNPPSRSPSSLRISRCRIGSSSEAACGKSLGIEARPLVLDDQGHRVGIDPIGDAQHQLGVLAVPPFDGIAAHLHHGLFQILDVPLGQGAVGEEVGQHVAGLGQVGELAADVEIDLAGRAALLVLVVPGEGLGHRRMELLGRERLGQVAVGPDPDAGGPLLRVMVRGDHDDRDQVRLPVPLQPIADLEPVDVGQDQVEEDQVGPPLGDRLQRLLTGEDLDRFETLGPHEMGQDIIGVGLIVNHQNGARHGQDPKRLRIV